MCSCASGWAAAAPAPSASPLLLLQHRRSPSPLDPAAAAGVCPGGAQWPLPPRQEGGLGGAGGRRGQPGSCREPRRRWMATQAALRPREPARPGCAPEPPRDARTALGEKAAGERAATDGTESEARQPSSCPSLVRGGKDGKSNCLRNSQVQIISEFPGALGSVQLSISCSGVYHSRGGREPPGLAGFAALAHAQVVQLHLFLALAPHLFPHCPRVPSGCVWALAAWTPEGLGLSQHGRELWWAGEQWARGQLGAAVPAQRPPPLWSLSSNPGSSLLQTPSPLQHLCPAAGHTGGS